MPILKCSPGQSFPPTLLIKECQFRRVGRPCEVMDIVNWTGCNIYLRIMVQRPRQWIELCSDLPVRIVHQRKVDPRFVSVLDGVFP